jgi:hypothetical protein
MSRTNFKLSLLACLCILVLVAGCGDDKTTAARTHHESNPIELVDIGAIIESVAPPEYVAPVGSPSAVDSAWLYGDYPLLDKVFGSRDPQTLYANINEFKRNIEILSNTARIDENGDIILGVYVDSQLTDMGDSEVMMHFTATVTALDGPTAIPASAQAVMGTEVDVDYLLDVVVEEMPGAVIKIGMTLNDSVQTIFQWDEGTSNDDEQTRLVYANLDLSDSSFTFKGLGYCQHPVNDQWPNGDLFCWAYNITSEADADFAYRMSYFSNGTPGTTCLNCFLGGGNKETEFALKYRFFIPADTNVCDSMWMRDQVFGPNYSEGTGLVTDYASYLDEALFFTNDNVTQVMIPDPWADQ